MVIPNYVVGGRTVEDAIKNHLPLKMFYKLIDGGIGFADKITEKEVRRVVQEEYGTSLPKGYNPNCEAFLKLKCLDKKVRKPIVEIEEQKATSAFEEAPIEFDPAKARSIDELVEVANAWGQ